MITETDEAETYRIERPFYGISRVLMVGAGLFCILTPAWDFRHAFRDFGWWTVFFGAIVAGAWSVGIVFLIGAFTTDSEVWTFRAGKLRVERASPLRRRSNVYSRDGIARIEIEEVEWESRANGFRVVLHLRSGERLETPDYGTVNKAEAIRTEIRRQLRMDTGERRGE